MSAEQILLDKWRNLTPEKQQEVIDFVEFLELRHKLQQDHQEVTEQTVAPQTSQTPLKLLISPQTDPTWTQRCQAVPKLLAEIDCRRQELPSDIEWLNSTNLIREERDWR